MSTSDDTELTVIGVALAVALVAGLLVWEGFALVQLWRWHAAPLGMPPLTLGHAIGLNLIVNIMTVRPAATTKDGDGALKALALWGFVGVPLALLIGWIVR